MNKMTGIVLMIAGALIFIGGIFVYSTSKKPVEQINSNFIAGNELDKFEKKVKNIFFFDIKTQELK